MSESERLAVDPLREALLRLTDAIDGERRDWHTVEVRPYDLVLVMGSAMHRLDAGSPAVPPEGLTRAALDDVLYRLREPFTYRKSWPNGKRWSVLDGSGFDDDVFDMFDTEAEAAAATKVANAMREDALSIAATVGLSDTGEGEKRGACVQAGLSWCSTHNRTFIEGQPHCRAFA